MLAALLKPQIVFQRGNILRVGTIPIGGSQNEWFIDCFHTADVR